MLDSCGSGQASRGNILNAGRELLIDGRQGAYGAG